MRIDPMARHHLLAVFVVSFLVGNTLQTSNNASSNITEKVGNNVTIHDHKITEPAGLYYEYMNKIHFKKSEWRLISYIDLKAFELVDDALVADRLSSKAEQRCKALQVHPERCEFVVRHDTRFQEYDTLAHNYLIQLKNLLNEAYSNPEVRKRGASSDDRIGRRQIMSDEDTRFYNEKIERFKDDELNIRSLLKHSMYIVPSRLERNMSNLTRLKNITLTRYTGIEEVEKVTWKNLKPPGFNYSDRDHLWMLSTLRKWMLGREDEAIARSNVLQKIIDTIYSIKTGILDPRFFNPEDMRKAIQHFHLHNDNTRFLFPLSLHQDYVRDLGEISRMEVGYHDNKIIFAFHIPLLEPNAYQLYQMHSYPVLTFLSGRHVAASIHPRADFIALSPGRYRYAFMHERDLEKCQLITNYHICDPTNPFYESATHKLCERTIISKNSGNPHDNCDVRINNVVNPYWKQLRSQRGWLYSLPLPEQVSIFCHGIENITIPLRGMGTLQIPDGCYAQTGYAIFMSNRVPGEIETIHHLTELDISSLLPTPVYYPDNCKGKKCVISHESSITEILNEIEEYQFAQKRTKQEKILYYLIIVTMGSFLLFFFCYRPEPLVLVLIRLLKSCVVHKCERYRPKKAEEVDEEEENEMNLKHVGHERSIYDTPSKPVKVF